MTRPPDPPKVSKSTRVIAFVGRCSGAATVAYELALSLGLPESLWAAMSALIVSQEHLHETRSSLTGRILGTLVGMAVTISVSEVASRVAAPTAVQIAVAVAISALVAGEFPRLRVAMWTCPIILLTAQPSVPVVMAALHRGGEVMLGALVGWAFHWAAEFLVDAFASEAEEPPRRRTSRHHRRRRPATRQGVPQAGGEQP
ncbi:MAG: FUSC family protein [Inquilinus sp.]|uniref:FUSC family protein n=1 Tax=Inquilinus sp. TaxID=1932117 RepID=UPI003F3017FE